MLHFGRLKEQGRCWLQGGVCNDQAYQAALGGAVPGQYCVISTYTSIDSRPHSRAGGAEAEVAGRAFGFRGVPEST